jgi:hypothetical protein
MRCVRTNAYNYWKSLSNTPPIRAQAHTCMARYTSASLIGFRIDFFNARLGNRMPREINALHIILLLFAIQLINKLLCAFCGYSNEAYMNLTWWHLRSAQSRFEFYLKGPDGMCLCICLTLE